MWSIPSLVLTLFQFTFCRYRHHKSWFSFESKLFYFIGCLWSLYFNRKKCTRIFGDLFAFCSISFICFVVLKSTRDDNRIETFTSPKLQSTFKYYIAFSLQQNCAIKSFVREQYSFVYRLNFSVTISKTWLLWWLCWYVELNKSKQILWRRILRYVRKLHWIK